jgi:DNA polymerase/3'-5' exonuclease PolX
MPGSPGAEQPQAPARRAGGGRRLTMKTKMPLVEARAIAEEWVAMLAPYCERVEIAGSVRRGKLEVGDIEIVCKPLMVEETDMFGVVTGHLSMVDALFAEGEYKLVKSGTRYKQVDLGEINLDLFCVIDPAQWGVLFLIRTGPAEYSHRFVTKKQQGGMLPSNMQVKDGAVWCNGKMYETPEEADVYKLIGAPYVNPNERR